MSHNTAYSTRNKVEDPSLATALKGCGHDNPVVTISFTYACRSKGTPSVSLQASRGRCSGFHPSVLMAPLTAGHRSCLGGSRTTTESCSTRPTPRAYSAQQASCYSGGTAVAEHFIKMEDTPSAARELLMERGWTPV